MITLVFNSNTGGQTPSILFHSTYQTLNKAAKLQKSTTTLKTNVLSPVKHLQSNIFTFRQIFPSLLWTNPRVRSNLTRVTPETTPKQLCVTQHCCCVLLSACSKQIHSHILAWEHTFRHRRRVGYTRKRTPDTVSTSVLIFSTNTHIQRHKKRITVCVCFESLQPEDTTLVPIPGTV
jgi:hypothetical protein